MYYLNSFLVYSILGYFLETLVAFFTHTNFQSGILYGPWTPIYGIGSVIILLLSYYLFYHLHLPRFYETIWVFFIVTIILTAIEWLGGIGIEYFFHIVFWDYSNSKWAIGKYISLTMSLLWGIISIFFIYVIEPFFRSLILRIPLFATILLLFFFFIDVIMTVLRYTH